MNIYLFVASLINEAHYPLLNATMLHYDILSQVPGGKALHKLLLWLLTLVKYWNMFQSEWTVFETFAVLNESPKNIQPLWAFSNDAYQQQALPLSVGELRPWAEPNPC